LIVARGLADARQDLAKRDQHVLRLQDAGDDLGHQPVPYLDVLAAHQRDVELVRRSPNADQLACAAHAGMPTAEDQHVRAGHRQGARLSAVRAAW